MYWKWVRLDELQVNKTHMLYYGSYRLYQLTVYLLIGVNACFLFTLCSHHMKWPRTEVICFVYGESLIAWWRHTRGLLCTILSVVDFFLYTTFVIY